MAETLLIIDGAGYFGWEHVSVNIGMEQMAGAFDLTLIDRWPGLAQPRPIRAGQSCVLQLDGAVVISGYIDDVEARITSSEQSLTVCGRDKTGDLVDCSVLVTKGQPGKWRNQTLLQIATDVCRPFGITVRAEVTLKPLRSANVQEGESAYELLDRLAKQDGVLLLTDGSGQLVIAAPGTQTVPVVLAEGVNLLEGRIRSSWRERFSQYVLKGQRPGGSGDDSRASAHVTSETADPEINRYRPLVVVADEHGGSPQRHVQWEARVRSGRGTRGSVKVVGWTHSGGLWRPNTRVRLVSPSLQTDDELMIASVHFSLSPAQGHVTELELADPNAFDVLAGLRASPLGRKAKGKDGLVEARAGDKGRGRKATEMPQ